MGDICNKRLDEERALYGLTGSIVENCTFAGPADGESALKESKNNLIRNCTFELRYPFWHVKDSKVVRVTMTESCRAPFWYCSHVGVVSTRISGPKAFRETYGCGLIDCIVDSAEFGWFTKNMEVENVRLTSEYPFFYSMTSNFRKLRLQGKYSFQYCTDMELHDCDLDTKDAFWHAKNVTVYDSVIQGEYLGWYSENLKLVRCKIIGTQPLCYCKGLVLEDCEMVDCDLSFENSEVQATVRGSIDSVKNPHRGFIHADCIGDVIIDEHKWPGYCEICNPA